MDKNLKILLELMFIFILWGFGYVLYSVVKLQPVYPLMTVVSFFLGRLSLLVENFILGDKNES